MNPLTINDVMATGLNEVETLKIEALLHAGGLAHPFPQIKSFALRTALPRRSTLIEATWGCAA